MIWGHIPRTLGQVRNKAIDRCKAGGLWHGALALCQEAFQMNFRYSRHVGFGVYGLGA